jgi:hypothetical protein
MDDSSWLRGTVKVLYSYALLKLEIDKAFSPQASFGIGVFAGFSVYFPRQISYTQRLSSLHTLFGRPVLNGPSPGNPLETRRVDVE